MAGLPADAVRGSAPERVDSDLDQGLSAADYPSLFIAADESSLSGHKSHVRLVKWELMLIVGASAVGALPVLFSHNVARPLFGIAAAMLLGSIVVRSANRIQESDSDWFEGRAVAETVKSMVWRYMMHLEPFDAADPEADKAFLQQLREVLQERPKLRHPIRNASALTTQITPRMRQIRAASLDTRKHIYLKDRVEDQISWYVRKSASHTRRATLWFWAGIGAQSLAAGWAIFRAVSPGTLDLVAVFSDMAVAVTAWVQLQKYDDLSKSYAMAAQELMILETLLEQAPDDDQFVQVVEDAEGSISREHKVWVSNR